MWQEQGWNTTVTTGAGDRGIDIIAEKSPFLSEASYSSKKIFRRQ